MTKPSGYELSYQATQDKGRRQAPASRTRSEDITLKPSARRKLLATARDQARNMSIVGWMVRRHVDYVSKFSPLVNTGDKALDDWLDKALHEHGKKRNFDVAKRHGRNSMMRIFEGLKVLDGDAALLKVDGYKVQGIEGDRIALPTDLPRELAGVVGDHGLVINSLTGATDQYCVCKRDDAGGTMLEYADLVDADRVVFDGYFGRFDQTRGISPLSSVINPTADLYEAMEWTQLKIKLHALMGIQINRETAGDATDGFPTTETADYDTDTASVQTTENRYAFDTKGVSIFDMDPGESINTIESGTPSEEFQHWTDKTIRQILLALDIPYSAFAGDESNFSARIADREEYEKSSQEKRQRNCEALEEVYDWVLRGWYAENRTFRRLVDAAGLTVDDLPFVIQWTSTGTPWLDKLKEVNGDAVAVYNCFESRQDVCKRKGKDFFEVCKRRAEEEAFAADLGVQLAMGSPGQQTISQVESQVEESEAAPMEDGEDG
jgi:capsid protein